MTAFPPAPPGVPSAPPPPLGPFDGLAKVEPPLASVRSQVAVYVVVVLAVAIPAVALEQNQVWVPVALALGAGAATGVLATIRRPFDTVPGGLLALFSVLGLAVVFGLLGAAGAELPLPLMAWTMGGVACFVIGLDWRFVQRLRPLVMLSGLAVVFGVLGEQSWTYPAAVAWLILAFGALTSLEADRRAAQPKVEAMTPGPSAPNLRTQDVVTTVLMALVLALVAGLLLGTPSCQKRNLFDFPNMPDLANRLGSPNYDPTTGRYDPGPPPDGSGTFGTGDHQYVPDPDGRYLIPEDGSGRDSAGDPTKRVPIPDSFDTTGGPTSFRTTDPDGTEFTYSDDGLGNIEITVTDPDGTVRTYRYDELPSGLIQIDEFDEQGRRTGTFYFDPEGRVAEDSRTTNAEPEREPYDSKPPSKDDDGSFRPNTKLILAIAAALLLLAGGIWLAMRRRNAPAPPPERPAPTWALHLAKQIEHEGRARGRSRQRSEPLVRYARALAGERLPDPRLVDVAVVVSDALFAATEPGPEAQAWAEATFAEVVAAHPAPSRSERRKAEAAGSRG